MCTAVHTSILSPPTVGREYFPTPVTLRLAVWFALANGVLVTRGPKCGCATWSGSCTLVTFDDGMSFAAPVHLAWDLGWALVQQTNPNPQLGPKPRPPTAEHQAYLDQRNFSWLVAPSAWEQMLVVSHWDLVYYVVLLWQKFANSQVSETDKGLNRSQFHEWALLKGHDSQT